MLDAEFWVSVAFFMFVALLGYLSVHKTVLGALDRRRTTIKTELDEARRLRQEAEQLLADYQRKRREAEQEAQAIVESARSEAERIAAEARTRMGTYCTGGPGMAHARIAQAEAQALSDVRAAAADAAVTAASKILVQTTTGEVADRLIAQGIKEIKAKLN